MYNRRDKVLLGVFHGFSKEWMQNIITRLNILEKENSVIYVDTEWSGEDMWKEVYDKQGYSIYVKDGENIYEAEHAQEVTSVGTTVITLTYTTGLGIEQIELLYQRGVVTKSHHIAGYTKDE